MTKWQINICESNLTLSEALSTRAPGAPAAFLRQICKKQRVTINGAIADPDQRVKLGEAIAIKTSQRWLDILAQSPLQPEQVLYEDQYCLVLNKPPGLAIHQAAGHDDNLLTRTSNYFKLRGETFKIAPIHRLDIDTSGAVLFGKGRQAISQLGQMLMAGEMSKRYLALVHGRVPSPGRLDSPVPAKGRIKSALTTYSPVTTTGKLTLLELELVTGRRHQIRQQLATAGWPIYGDTRYNQQPVNHGIRSFLHCYHLAFKNPFSCQHVAVRCPLPADLHKLLSEFEFEPDTYAGFIQ